MFPVRKPLCATLLVAGLFSLTWAVPGCSRNESPERVSLREPTAAPQGAPKTRPARRLRVAIAAMISPKETYVSYKDLMRYMGEKLGTDVELIQRKTYGEVNELLRKNLLDLAFVCTGAYVEGHDQFGMDILVAPVTQGRTVYYSYIIVPKDSKTTSLEGLRAKSFAFTDPMSNTGRLAPAYMLAKMGQTPESFFGHTTYTYSHDKSIESVARKLVDGAAVDSLIWDYMNQKDPNFTSETKIIRKSDPYGIPPIVVNKALDPDLRAKLLATFLSIHEDPKGKDILSKIMIERFTIVDDSTYDSVRSMKSWVDTNVKK